MTTTLRSLVLLCGLLLVGGCPLPTGSSYGKPCDADADCADGYRCWPDTCVPDAFGDPPPGDAGDPPKDSGADDAGGDAGVDAGVDAGEDDDAGFAGVDAGFEDAGADDGGEDAGPVDGGEDGGEDGGDDAGEPGPHWCEPGNVIDVDLSLTSTYTGDTRVGVGAFTGTCGFDDVPEQVLRFTPPGPGTLHYELRSDLDFVVAFFDGCDPSTAIERKCIDRERPARTEWGKLIVDSAEPVYLVVDGFGEGDQAPWTLDLRFVEPSCGNGHADLGETCDLSPVEAPWCVACQLTSSPESEPNGELSQSNSLLLSYAWGRIDPIGDVDVFDFSVSEPNSSVTVEVTDAFDGTACSDPEVIDAQIEILDSSGNVLAVADGGRGSGCPTARALIASPDTYFARVRQAKNFATTPTLRFSYGLRLETAVAVCGNGVLDVGEQCDDGNLVVDDGCSPSCAFETVAELEPNSEAAEVEATPRNRGNDFTISAVHGPISEDVVIDAALLPVGDEDGYWLLQSSADSVTVTARIVNPAGPYVECDVATLDVLLHVLDDNAQVLITGDTPTEVACDEVTFELPRDVSRYLHVHDYGDDSPVDGYYLQILFHDAP